MLNDERPTLIDLFYRAERRPDVHFYTSNIDKFLQARAVFDKHGLILQHFRSRTDPYNEDYTKGKAALLARAVNDVRTVVGANSVFFVEDTSIRIEALSDGENDWPGLAAKEWFSETSFEFLDHELKARGKDRRAIVKSDIALHIPGLIRPIYFHGDTSGHIAPTSPTFLASTPHPWLTPLTFNGWLIPSGARKRLGEMSFEESWKYDFRIEALVHMLKRLEELTAALNLPISAYSRKSASAVTSQLSLLDSKRKVFVVVGRTCAGKTTMCERLSAAHGFTVFEASAVLRSIAESAGVAREANITEQQFAASVLDQFGADAVARKIAEFLDGTHVDKLAISGFRTIEELESIRGHFPETQIILVEASERTRFERRIRRGRADETLTFEQFNKLDQSQWQLGLLRVAEQLADLRVVNEIDIETYYRAVDSLAGSSAIPFGQVIHRVTAANLDFESNQLARCLEVLEQAARPLDCGEIEERTAALGARIRHNNANKVLKAAPELAVRLEMQGSRVRYRIGSAGYAFLRLLRHRDEAQKRTATSPT